ncbi:hypothetical protein QQS21_005866 [Conoideocrella luteorostrata]|uniref:Uncharacterized protein n=1 Tax=Conoideocrella luteorostrata TaxID=1105319 RepID=A0AAJ0G0L7_9HYPO|nr:hypothetical protein QQS21_005866 [Conoideocrella luteorostrata]
MPLHSHPARLRVNKNQFDKWKPNNPNIPFFYCIEKYKRVLLKEPHPGRNWVYPVEPGLFSIEVYEAIIANSPGHCPLPLERYICECGVAQICRSRWPYAPASAAEDKRLREERDICFTLVSTAEANQINDWMKNHGIDMCPCPRMATPYGYMDIGKPVGVQIGQKTYKELGLSLGQQACKELGFGIDDSDYPRSALPPGVIPMGHKTVDEWTLPSADGVARDGRATDDCSIQRIEWPVRRVV